MIIKSNRIDPNLLDDFEDGRRQAAADWVWEYRKLTNKEYPNMSERWWEGYNYGWRNYQGTL